MEVYKRSQRFSEYELNQLLMLNANGLFWKKIEKPKSAFNEEKAPLSVKGF